MTKLATLLAMAAFGIPWNGSVLGMGDEETKQVLFEIWRDCKLGGYLLVERDGKVRIIVNPAVRQLLLTRERRECAERSVRKRLGRELSE